MAGWQHRCNGHELGQTSGNGEGQGGLACCSPWGRQELDTTGQLNNNNKYSIPILFTRKLSFHGLSHNYKLFQSTILTCTLRLPCASVLCHSVMFNSATLWTSVLPVPHLLPKLAQVHVHCFGDDIQPSHCLMSSSPSALDISQDQGLFQ